ncbi:heterogeneous nuclear ribonucleoprotein 1-like isoform X1 [Phragmites australis]|uniref:heterogeneous nuclear ribonucleoprotein 1-like isoform X1 n=1 Tax=Phragmites australis TaxID=29695 RepID=UPI002D796136|nr:heterogeneous nuclear ribonucleoprotein 1-like isoform X1 [Phragmites australis]
MAGKMKEFDGASPAKIFIGGLSKDTGMGTFKEHFGKYGQITDAVIMKDRYTQKPRGFGFITYADPAVVDRVIEDEHVINGKQVEIKRTIPKGAAPLKDFKTKKIFVGGLASALKEDEFKEFFSKFGKVVEHEIIRDHATNRSRGFGFIVFDAEKTVDELLAKKGNMIDLNGSQVEIKKAEPKKPSNPPPRSFDSEPRGRPYASSYDGFGSSYNYGGSGPYRSPGSFGARPGGYSSAYGPGDYGSGYGAYGGALGGYRGESALYSSRFGSSYGGSFGGGYGGGSYAGGLAGAYGRDAEAYSGSSYGPSYDASGASAGAGAGAGFGTGALYGARTGYGSTGGSGAAGRYHPYGR